LTKDAVAVLTMDKARRELAGADILIRDGVIAEVGVGLEADGADIVLAAGCVVTPGLVNTHHH
jgi:cytosine/adenosine deaminase-related metal-dependent hydrolase